MVSTIVVGIIAAIHLYIVYLEMFLWTTPKGMKIFGTTERAARESKTLAANQGLYNGFLAAGLIWSLLHPDAAAAHDLKLFFLLCVLAAGLYGGITVKKSILLVQALPAAVGLIALWL